MNLQSKLNSATINDKMFQIYAQSEDNATPPMDCDVELEAFQRVGPSSSDAAPQGEQ